MKARIRIPNPNTSVQTIMGMQTDGVGALVRPITCRITSDAHGKSISLSNEEDLMLMIPLEPIMARLREVLKDETD